MSTRQEIVGRLEKVEQTQEHLVEGLKYEIKELGKKLERSEAALEEAQGEIERLRKESSDIPLLKAFSDYVDERVKKWAGQPVAEGSVSQDIVLGKVKTTISVKEVRRELPEADTTTPRGKVLLLVAQGRLDSPKAVSEVTGMLDGALGRLDVLSACKKLASEQILVEGKASNRVTTYKKHPDVAVAVKKTDRLTF